MSVCGENGRNEEKASSTGAEGGLRSRESLRGPVSAWQGVFGWQTPEYGKTRQIGVQERTRQAAGDLGTSTPTCTTSNLSQTGRVWRLCFVLFLCHGRALSRFSLGASPSSFPPASIAKMISLCLHTHHTTCPETVRRRANAPAQTLEPLLASFSCNTRPHEATPFRPRDFSPLLCLLPPPTSSSPRVTPLHHHLLFEHTPNWHCGHSGRAQSTILLRSADPLARSLSLSLSLSRLSLSLSDAPPDPRLSLPRALPALQSPTHSLTLCCVLVCYCARASRRWYLLLAIRLAHALSLTRRGPLAPRIIHRASSARPSTCFSPLWRS